MSITYSEFLKKFSNLTVCSIKNAFSGRRFRFVCGRPAKNRRAAETTRLLNLDVIAAADAGEG
jgi:hypothetical protein